jgi:hypothetical protein
MIKKILGIGILIVVLLFSVLFVEFFKRYQKREKIMSKSNPFCCCFSDNKSMSTNESDTLIITGNDTINKE